MRFVLDMDVDATLAARLREAGHDCWTAAAAGLHKAHDDAVAVHADDRRAVLISHDNKFARRRSLNTIGRHVWLRCTQPDAVDVVMRHLPDILRPLMRMQDVVLEVRPEGVRVLPPRWQ